VKIFLQEIIYNQSNSHVADDAMRLRKVKVMTRIHLWLNISKPFIQHYSISGICWNTTVLMVLTFQKLVTSAKKYCFVARFFVCDQAF